MNIKRLALWFYLLCKRQLKNIVLTFFLLAMPVTAFIVHQLPAMEEGGIPQIALWITDDDGLSQSAVQTLLAKNEGVHFYKSPSLEQLKADIIEGRADCGYVFKENLSAALEQYRLKDCILLVRNQESFVTGIINEIVVSAVITHYSRQITLDFMQTHHLLQDDAPSGVPIHELTRYFNERFDRRLAGGSSLQLQFETVEKKEGEFVTHAIETKSMGFPLRGIIAVLIYTACISGAIQWISDKESSLFAPMERSFCRISRPLYILVPALFFSASGLASVYLSGTGERFAKEALVLLFYILLNTAMGTLLTLVFQKSRTLSALLPVIILCSLLLCPVFLDLRPYLPVTGILNKLFLPYYYLYFF